VVRFVIAAQLQPIRSFYAVSIFAFNKNFHRELTGGLPARGEHLYYQ
jgi:hypothetical protein